ncbi:MAG: hypothetical protein AAFR87_26045 [Bacteroidota bacterium]
MNLEELKEIWSSHSSDLSRDQYLNHRQIQLLLERRSQGALSRINRNILIEVLASAMLGIGLVYWLWTRKEEVATWEIILFSIMFMGTGLFYYYKYKALNRNDLHSDNLMESLESITRNMGTYMRGYLYAVIFLVPTLAFTGGYYGLYVRRLSTGSEDPILSGEGWFLFGAGMLLYAIFAIFGTNWYYRRLYGRHYQELKQCLAELKEL